MIKAIEEVISVADSLLKLGEHGPGFLALAQPWSYIIAVCGIVIAILVPLTKEWWLPLLSAFTRTGSNRRIWLFRMKNLSSLASSMADAKRTSSNPTDLRLSLERSWELQHLIDLIQGRYLQAWRLDRSTGRLEILPPERVGAIRGLAVADSTNIFIKQNEVAGAKRRYNADCDVTDNFRFKGVR
jgi:hypothetical protein